MFVDKAKIYIKAGNGGNGKVSFRREKYVPNGGPDGGDGGKGGDIVFVVDESMRTLMDFRYKRKHVAQNGEDGGAVDMFGASAEDTVIKVPPGTIIRDVETGYAIADLKENGERFVAAKGGKGGKGNVHFTTPVRQAPRFAQPGGKGEERTVELELKLIADVGLLGFPNVGKSTLLSVISSARPKIANYHFTTLQPNLGVVDLGEGRSFVVADIPGIIEGAHEGIGLGIEFLRHVERTKVLIHVVDASGIEGREPVEDYRHINQELALYSEKLSHKPQILACNKMDIPESEEHFENVKKELSEEVLGIFPISAATNSGIRPLMEKVWEVLKNAPVEEEIEEIVNIAKIKDPEDKGFTVEVVNRVFIVEGPAIERILESVNMEDNDSLKFFQRVLQKKGIIEELKNHGVQDGDAVRMYELEFEFYN